MPTPPLTATTLDVLIDAATGRLPNRLHRPDIAAVAAQLAGGDAPLLNGAALTDAGAQALQAWCDAAVNTDYSTAAVA